MSSHDIFRFLARSVAVALPTAPAATAHTALSLGPTIVTFVGIDIPIGSMVLSGCGLLLARGVSSAREGPEPGGWYLNGVLLLILFGVVVNFQPGVGPAIAWGVGIGGSGIVLFDILRDRVLGAFRNTTAGEQHTNRVMGQMIDSLPKEKDEKK